MFIEYKNYMFNTNTISAIFFNLELTFASKNQITIHTIINTTDQRQHVFKENISINNNEIQELAIFTENIASMGRDPQEHKSRLNNIKTLLLNHNEEYQAIIHELHTLLNVTKLNKSDNK